MMQHQRKVRKIDVKSFEYLHGNKSVLELITVKKKIFKNMAIISECQSQHVYAIVLPREQQGTKFCSHYNANEFGKIFNYYESSHKHKMRRYVVFINPDI